jgi:hypothetical protein
MNKIILIFIAIVALNVNLEAQERQNPVLQFDFVSIEDADRFRFMEFLSFTSEMHSLRIEKGFIDFFHVWEVQHDSHMGNDDYEYIIVSRTSYGNTVQTSSEDWQSYLDNLKDSGIKSPFLTGNYDLGRIYKEYNEMATHDEMYLYQVADAPFDSSISLEEGWITKINFMKQTNNSYQQNEANLAEFANRRIQAGCIDGWGFLGNLYGYATDSYSSHLTVDFWKDAESFVNQGIGDQEILNYTDDDGELIDKVLLSRDLRRSIVATLIIVK